MIFAQRYYLKTISLAAALRGINHKEIILPFARFQSNAFQLYWHFTPE